MLKYSTEGVSAPPVATFEVEPGDVNFEQTFGQVVLTGDTDGI